MDPELPPQKSKHEIYEEVQKWCVDNSVPKRRPKPVISRGPIATPEALAKSETLAAFRPRRKYIPPRLDPTSWVYLLKHKVKPGALTYVISERINTMSEPMPRRIYIRPEDNPSDWVYILKHKVSPEALKYVPSERVEELCKQRKRWIYRRPRKRPSSGVRRKALKAKASKRTIKLATPKVREALQERDWIYTVNPVALTFNATKRLKKLAHPKEFLLKLAGRHVHCVSEEESGGKKKKQNKKKK